MKCRTEKERGAHVGPPFHRDQTRLALLGALLCGLFLGGLFRGGLFLGGLFRGGLFRGGLFRGGLFRGGLFLGGLLLGGLLLGGLLLGGLLLCSFLLCHGRVLPPFGFGLRPAEPQRFVSVFRTAVSVQIHGDLKIMGMPNFLWTSPLHS